MKNLNFKIKNKKSELTFFLKKKTNIELSKLDIYTLSSKKYDHKNFPKQSSKSKATKNYEMENLY